MTYLAELRLAFARLFRFLGRGARDTLAGLRDDFSEFRRLVRETLG
jgi:hypothetical protein